MPTLTPGQKAIIDVHTHVFNAGFMPVRGVLQKVGGMPKWSATFVAAVVNALLEREYQDTPDSHIEVAARELRRPHATTTAFLGDLAREIPDETALALATSYEANAAALELVHGSALSGIAMASTALTVDVATADQARDRIAALLTSIAGRLGAEVAGWLRWICLMVQHEIRLADTLPAVWSPSTDRPIAAFVHHVIDAESRFGSAPVYAPDEQIRRMVALRDEMAARRPQLSYIAFVGFDPYRNGGLDLVKAALDPANDGAFVGVKLYPPLGFSPNPGDNAPDVGARLQGLYDHCIAGDVPIFAHCEPDGIEANHGDAAMYAGPLLWKKVLYQARWKNLRLCLGHAGGEEVWVGMSASVTAWAEDVVSLCTNCPNVYCEFAYLEELLIPADLQKFEQILAKRIQDGPGTQPGTYSLAAKCCYGSDWHVLVKEAGFEGYAASLDYALTQTPSLAPFAQAILYENARSFLNM